MNKDDKNQNLNCKVDIENLKKEIDNMSHEDLARLWRFGDSSNELIQGEVGEYLKDRLFNHFNGFNTELSKKIGW
jgi:methylphosphotriester-DNA--protein-cysteine methyltransferase